LHDARKKKTKKTQQTQYADDDNHPVHSNEIGYGGVVPRVDSVKSISFVISLRTNKLVYNQDRYTDEQEHLFQLVNHLRDSGLGFRKISQYLNERGYKLKCNKEFRSSDVWSLILRNRQRKERIELRNKEYPLTIKDFRLNFWD
jgi:hypothetical protein